MYRIKLTIIISLALVIAMGSAAFAYVFFQNNASTSPVFAEKEADAAGTAQQRLTDPALENAVTESPMPAALSAPSLLEPAPPKIVVLVDAGHGGTDSGADYGGVEEKDINLNIAKLLLQIFEQDSDSPVQIHLTRQEDETVFLSERVGLANQDAAFFLSIHCNVDESSARRRGAITFFQTHEGVDKPFTSRELAESIQKHLVDSTKCADLGIEYNNEYYLLNHTAVPAVIAEVGFMSSPEELSLLRKKDYQARVARGLYDAILEMAGRFAPAE